MKIKCINTGDNEYITLGGTYEVIQEDILPFGSQVGYRIVNDIGQSRIYKKERFEIVKENEDMKELTFREVIANIKEGEIWENEHKIIGCEPAGIRIKVKNLIFDGEMCFHNEAKFKLKRNRVSFQEAIAACEEGREIQSCVSNRRFTIISNMIHSVKTDQNIATPIHDSLKVFSFGEIKGEWYIN